MQYGFKPTTTGRTIMAACAAKSAPLTLTRVAFGDGKLEPGTDLAEVHELVHYVADGAIGDRDHTGDHLHLTVQYTNYDHQDLPAFALAEFIVYATDPDTGEEQDLIYATLGDHTQSVPAYNASYPPWLWKLPLTIILSDAVEVQVTAPSGLVTFDMLQEQVTTACAELVETMVTGGVKKILVTTVPADQWKPDPEPQNGYVYFYDIQDPDITETYVPDVTLDEASLLTAYRCGMCETAVSSAGAVRIKCKKKPDKEITLSCCLLGTKKERV